MIVPPLPGCAVTAVRADPGWTTCITAAVELAQVVPLDALVAAARFSRRRKVTVRVIHRTPWSVTSRARVWVEMRLALNKAERTEQVAGWIAHLTSPLADVG